MTSFLHLNVQDYVFEPHITDLTKVCICCTSQNAVLINICSCNHTSFLENYIKSGIDLKNTYICNICHNMLRKIEVFKQQVEESIALLLDQVPILKINKLHNLHRTPMEIDGVTKLETEIDVKPEPSDSECLEVETDVKVEHDSSENEAEPLAELKRKKRKSRNELRTAYNYPMADKPDEPTDLTDLPLPSRSNAPVETQDAAASMPADIDAAASCVSRHSLSTPSTPFAKPPTIAAPKSSAQRQREYRQRIAASRTPAQSTAMRISDTERKRNYRLRKAANLALASGSLESTTASSSRSAGRSNDVQNSTQRQLTNQQRQSLAAEPAQPGTSSDRIEVQQPLSTWNTKWKSSIMRFTSTFLDNDFGYTCSVCDRLWFKDDLKPITAAQLKVISDWFIKENRQLCREEYELVCNTCKRSIPNFNLSKIIIDTLGQSSPR